MAWRVHRTVLLCGMAGCAVAKSALCSAAAVDGSFTPQVVVADEHGARCFALVADGRYQCLVVVCGGSRFVFGSGLLQDEEVVVVDRCADSSSGLLADRTSHLDLCGDPCAAVGVETSVDIWLAVGCPTGGLCLVPPAVATPAGLHGAELLPCPFT